MDDAFDVDTFMTADLQGRETAARGLSKGNGCMSFFMGCMYGS